MANKIKILGIAGSLRKGSYNRALLKKAVELCPAEAEIEVFDLNQIPPYDQDLESAMPAAVRDLKRKIVECDGILISTPEYNYSVPGVLKNAIDWASRPYGDNSWKGKLAAIMGGSSGGFGTVRCQLHLRQILFYHDITLLAHPELMVSFIQDKFDKAGNLTDKETGDNLKKLLDAFIELIRKNKAIPA